MDRQFADCGGRNDLADARSIIRPRGSPENGPKMRVFAGVYGPKTAHFPTAQEPLFVDIEEVNATLSQGTPGANPCKTRRSIVRPGRCRRRNGANSTHPCTPLYGAPYPLILAFLLNLSSPPGKIRRLFFLRVGSGSLNPVRQNLHSPAQERGEGVVQPTPLVGPAGCVEHRGTVRLHPGLADLILVDEEHEVAAA